MRPSTAPGTYLFSIIALSLFAAIRALESTSVARSVNAGGICFSEPRFRAILDVSSDTRTRPSNVTVSHRPGNSCVIAIPTAQHGRVRSITLLAAAGFASQAQVRVTDSLLPQIAIDFHTTVGVAAIVRHRLRRHARIHAVRRRADGRPFRQIPHRRRRQRVAALLVALCGIARRCRSLRWRGWRPAPLPAG